MNSFILNFITFATGTEPQYFGAESWAYYLMGAIFMVLTFVSLYFVYRFRNVRQYEHLYAAFGEVKKFWYKNRFLIMIMLSIVCFVTSIIFFVFNSTFLN